MKLVKNKAFLVIFLFLGGAMGYISTLQTKLEQVRDRHPMLMMIIN